MTDNIPVPSTAGGLPVATDDVDNVHYQKNKPTFGPDGTAPTPVEDALAKRLPVKVGEHPGATNIAHGGSAGNVTTSTGILIAARATRRRAIVTHKGDGGSVFVGANAVAENQGAFLPANAGAQAVFETTAAIHAIAIEAAATVTYYEEYD